MNTSATLTIKGWSALEPVYLGGISQQQLSQIRFETDGGIFGAQQWGHGFVVPGALVLEAPPLLFVPLLAAVALWKERGRMQETFRRIWQLGTKWSQ